MFSCEFCKISKNTFFTEHLWATASEIFRLIWLSSQKQFRFLSSHSINHVFITITEKIRETSDENEYTYGVFLDFQKTFDTVNHEILFDRLAHCGMRGVTKTGP